MGDRDFRTIIKNAVDSIGKELEIDDERPYIELVEINNKFVIFSIA